MARLAPLALAAAALITTLTACGEATRSSAAEPAFSPRGDFVDVFNAELAGGQRELSLAVAGRAPGRKRSTLTVRVYRKTRDARWASEPPLPVGLDPSGSPHLVQYRGTSCIGYETSGEPRTLACADGRRWRPLPTAGMPPASARLTALTVADGTLTAAFLAGEGRRARLAVLELRGGRWRPLGPALPTRGTIAVLGQPTESRTIDVVLADPRDSSRTIWTLSDRQWRRQSVLRGPGAGPQPSGPVRLGDNLYLAVTDAAATPWSFSVYALSAGRWARLGTRLSSGPGNAQGVIDAVDGTVWATWQENDLLDQGGFATRMFTQQITPAAQNPRQLWSGVSLGPGDLTTTAALGEEWVLFMPRPANSRYLTARVESVP